jgi:3-methyladenine DNA glycosylase AlkD
MRKPRPDELAARIEAELRRLGAPERTAGAKRYLKSDLVFLGVDTAAFRATVKTVLGENPSLDRGALLKLVKALWPRGIFELRAAAVELLMLCGPLLQAADLALVERLLRDSHTWALVDAIAVHVAGPLVVRFPGLGTTPDRWAEDADFWVRRAAMLALLLPLRRGGGRLRTLLALRRPHARGEGVLHPRGDRLGAAGDREEATGSGRGVAWAAHRPGLRRDNAGSGEVRTESAARGTARGVSRAAPCDREA